MRRIFIFKTSCPKQIKQWSRHCTHSQPVYFFQKRTLSERVSRLLVELGWKALPRLKLEDSLRERFLHEYLEIVAQFAEWNAQTIFWWATHFSSKNRINSPVLLFLEEWVECIQAIELCPDEKTLVLIDVSWEVIAGLDALAAKHEWEILVYALPLNRLCYRIQKKFRFWKNFFGEVIGTIVSIRAARKTFGRPKFATQSNAFRYLIKSFTYLRNFKEKDEYIDPFFGHLPEYIRQSCGQPSSVLTVALGFQDRKQCYALMKELPVALHPLESYLNYSDVFVKACQWLYQFMFNRFGVKGKIELWGYEATAFFREYVFCGGLAISFFQFMHFDVAKRLGKKYQIKNCLMTYEGRPWERLFIAGLRESCPDIHIIGCQHTVIPLSAADMFLHPQEKTLVPLPDRVITNGLITKKILDKYSAYPKEKVHVGCALRFEALQKLSLLPRKKTQETQETPFTLLVAFGGSDEEVPLLNYALQQALEMPEVVFRTRTHPTFPFDQLLQRSLWNERKLPENLQDSRKPSVIEDLQICNAVLYWGTTVSLEALMVGKPIIQFDRGDFLNYDPLFEFKDFKWPVCEGVSLRDAIQEIRDMPEAQYAELQVKGRKYVEDYFYPVTSEYLSLFLPVAEC